MRSYSSDFKGWGRLLLEAPKLYTAQTRCLAERVRDRIDDLRQVQARIEDAFQRDLCGMDVLEIGPGQFLTQLTLLALRNRAIGADLEVIAQGIDPLAYARMLFRNGLRRTVKTLGRKLLGVDRRYARELARQLGVPRLPRPQVLQMDSCRLRFADASFDLVYCRSVLQHVPQPQAAIREMRRVLRPGGIAYVSVHLYTSETGSLDPRVFHSQRQHEIRGWPHLQPQLKASIRSTAYLNQLRLQDWRDAFAAWMPDTRFILNASRTDAVRIRSAATALHERGRLTEYSVEELETFELVALWSKPADDDRRGSAR
jgi:SAM-dependent methyltransferase